MSIPTNEIRLKSRPSGLPSEDDFELVETMLDNPQTANCWSATCGCRLILTCAGA